MTDTTPTPNIPAAIVCPEEGCHALVPDTLDDRREHRRGHKHREKVDEAIRTALRQLRTDFDRLRGETRGQVKEIRDEVAGIDRAVGQIEIPEPVQPLTITRGAWEDDDEISDDRPTRDEDWDFSTSAPTEPDDELDDAQTTARADATAAFTADDLDDRDYAPFPRPVP